MRKSFMAVFAGILVVYSAASAPAIELARILPNPRRCPPAWQGNPRSVSPQGQSARQGNPQSVSPQDQSAWRGNPRSISPRGQSAWRGNPRSISPRGQSAWQGNPQSVSPQGQSAGIPGPHRYPEYNKSSPWYGYGFGVPTYRWGYFGATYRPAVITHRGYYGDFYQWGYRRGY